MVTVMSIAMQIVSSFARKKPRNLPSHRQRDRMVSRLCVCPQFINHIIGGYRIIQCVIIEGIFQR